MAKKTNKKRGEKDASLAQDGSTASDEKLESNGGPQGILEVRGETRVIVGANACSSSEVDAPAEVEVQENVEASSADALQVVKKEAISVKKLLLNASDEEKKRISVIAKNEGNRALWKGENELAIKFYNKAIELDPTNYVLFSNRSAAFYNTRQFEASLEDANKVLELNPQWWKAYKRKASSLMSLGDYEGCIETFKKGLEVSGGNEELKRAMEDAQQVIEYQQRNDEVMQRLEGVPVFTVATADGQPVLVSLGPQQPGWQVCTFFFSHEDAQNFLERITQQSPEVGKNARVEMVGLDKAYELAKLIEWQPPNGEMVVGCLMPEAKQVQAAMQIMAGTNKKGPEPQFQGVPVFQARHLTMLQGDKRSIPLFFSKDDLDAAWDQLRQQKVDVPDKATVEVGSLGDVLKRMAEADGMEELEQVVFIPSREALEFVEAQQSLEGCGEDTAVEEPTARTDDDTTAETENENSATESKDAAVSIENSPPVIACQ